MRLLFYSPSNAIGGAELSLFALIKEFRSRGFEIFLALPKGKNADYVNKIEPYVNEIFFVKSMPWIYYGNPNYFKRLYNFLYQNYKTKGGHLVSVLKFLWILYSKKIDFSFTNTIYTFDLGLASWILRLKHIQYVREPISSNGEGLVKLKLGNSSFTRWLYDRFNHKIICNSFFTFNGCKNYFPQKKLVVIYNPIDPVTIEQKLNFNASLKIVIVANLTSNWKNHSFAIKVASSLNRIYPNNSFRFCFYGNLPNSNNEYFENLKNMIREFGIESRISFEGLRSVDEIYENAFAMLHPSGLETFGRIYVEAMSARVPVIAVRGGAAIELIDHLKNGILVEHDDPDQTSNWLMKLLNDHTLRSNLVTNGLKFAGKFNPKSIVDQLTDSLI